MSFRPDHDLHRRRLGRNLGLGGALLVFVILVFGMTIEKIAYGGATVAEMMGQANTAAGAAKRPGTVAFKAVSSTETPAKSGDGN